MLDKLYYIPGNHKIVHVKEDLGDGIILSGACNYLSDSKTTILRQFILKEDFDKYRPKEIIEKDLINNLPKYLAPSAASFRVRKIYQENHFCNYLKLAKPRADARLPFKYGI